MLRYTGMGGMWIPPDGAKNALASGWTETQPNKLKLVYPSGSPAKLDRLQSASGDRWTLAYDADRIAYILDPFARRTSYSYSSGKILRVTDTGGRITTFSVDGSANLTKLTSLELDVTTLVYDASHRLKAWVTPLGERTTEPAGADHDPSVQLAELPHRRDRRAGEPHELRP